jgi:signal transduction histidine kinase
MRFCVWVWVLVLFGVAVMAQQPPLATLEQELAEVTSDSAKIHLLNQLAERYYNIDIKKSLEFGQDALALANTTASPEGIHESYKILRRIHRRLGNYSVAIEFTLKTLPELEKQKDTLELLDAYMTLGNINSAMENYPEAQSALLKALDLARKINAPTLANVLNYTGRNYGKIKKYDSALLCLREALQRETALPQPGYGLSYIYNNLGEVYLDLERHDEAIHYYNLSYNLSEDHKSSFGKTFTLNGLARIYQKTKQYPMAIAMANQSIAIAKEYLYRDKAKEAYGILYEVYQAMGDYKKSLEHYKQFNLYQDSIFSEDNIQLIENLKINYETERIRQENELLKKDAELKDSILNQQYALGWVAGITIVSLLLVSFLLYRNSVQRRKNNLLLQQYNEQLEKDVQARTRELATTNVELGKQNGQLEQFSYIIAHNLRSPVARIQGLVHLTKASPTTDSEVMEKLQEATKELLTTIEDLTHIIRVKKAIHESYEMLNLEERLHKTRIVLRDRIKEIQPEIQLNLMQTTCYGIGVYLDSVLYNLISNALKYRSPKRPLHLIISSARDLDFCVITVADNGLGMDMTHVGPKIFNLYQRFHLNTEGKGLGLFLVRTQMEAMGGSISVTSEVDKGTTFTLRLPVSSIKK